MSSAIVAAAQAHAAQIPASPPCTPDENSIRITVESAGAIYRGIQPGFPERNIESLVLFDDASAPLLSRSTLAVKLSQISKQAVEQQLQQLRQKYVDASLRIEGDGARHAQR